MKNLSLIEKLFFFGNSIAAFLFLVSLLLPFINPLLFPYLSTLSLLTPFLIFLNFLFVFFWVTKLKKHFLLSMLILLMGYGFVFNFINFSNNSLFVC